MLNLQTPSEVLILGGGVIGLSLAWELAGRGKQVRVVDRGELGSGASWAGAGILPPAPTCDTSEPYEQLQALSYRLHGEWAEQLRRETGIDTGFQRCGGVYLASSPAEAATLAANRGWWEDHGIQAQPWTAAELVQYEPSLAEFARRNLLAAWFLPQECQLRNPRHLKALVAACRLRKVELIPHCPVERLVIEGGRAIGVHSAEGTLPARQICVCSGAWARETLESLGYRTGIMPVRGQIVLYDCQRPLLQHVINEGHRYLVPRQDGRLLAGSVEEEVGYAIETTEAAIAHIRGWAERVVPQLAECRIERRWAGLRPGSYDGFPYMGPAPGIDNLFVAAGHFRSGIYLSCGTAVLVADQMEGRPSSIDLSPFRVGRG